MNVLFAQGFRFHQSDLFLAWNETAPATGPFGRSITPRASALYRSSRPKALAILDGNAPGKGSQSEIEPRSVEMTNENPGSSGNLLLAINALLLFAAGLDVQSISGSI